MINCLHGGLKFGTYIFVFIQYSSYLNFSNLNRSRTKQMAKSQKKFWREYLPSFWKLFFSIIHRNVNVFFFGFETIALFYIYLIEFWEYCLSVCVGVMRRALDHRARVGSSWRGAREWGSIRERPPLWRHRRGDSGERSPSSPRGWAGSGGHPR